MSDTSSHAHCDTACLRSSPTDTACGCAPKAALVPKKTAKYLAGYISLCAVCCAIPAVLVGFGLIGLGTAAYIGTGSFIAMFILGALGGGLLLRQYARFR